MKKSLLAVLAFNLVMSAPGMAEGKKKKAKEVKKEEKESQEISVGAQAYGEASVGYRKKNGQKKQVAHEAQVEVEGYVQSESKKDETKSKVSVGVSAEEVKNPREGTKYTGRDADSSVGAHVAISAEDQHNHIKGKIANIWLKEDQASALSLSAGHCNSFAPKKDDYNYCLEVTVSEWISHSDASKSTELSAAFDACKKLTDSGKLSLCLQAMVTGTTPNDFKKLTEVLYSGAIQLRYEPSRVFNVFAGPRYIYESSYGSESGSGSQFLGLTVGISGDINSGAIKKSKKK